MNKYYQKGVYPSTYKIVVIGDLHGDYRATISALLKGKIINKQLKWIGGKTNVIQMGDILDRRARSVTNTDEDSEFKIMRLIIKLQKEAYKAGGAFHCILGNHEILNILGYFDYVSPLGIKHFKKGIKERKRYFKPGGIISNIFANSWNTIIRIGKFVFVHGGISKYISKKYSNKIPIINQFMRLFLKGNTKLFKKKEFNELFMDDNSLLWNREYSNGKLSKKKCKELKEIAKNMNVSYIVVGHTPQIKGINIECNIWRTDTGMSEAFGKFSNNRIQVLEILRNGNSFKIIK
jgi:hypothetical protein